MHIDVHSGKSKIEKLFKYNMTNIKNFQTPIENYDEISLVITLYIANKLGKEIDYDDFLFRIHVKIKNGFNLLAPPEIKGRPRKTAFQMAYSSNKGHANDYAGYSEANSNN
jgi:hypothetical protein